MITLGLLAFAPKQVIRLGEVITDIGAVQGDDDLAADLIQANVAHVLAFGVLEDIF